MLLSMSRNRIFPALKAGDHTGKSGFISVSGMLCLSGIPDIGCTDYQF